MDTIMLAGCFGFVIVSIGTYLISICPFFIFLHHELLAEVERCALYGFVPAALAGIVGIRKFGLPGAAGFVGSALATAIFLYLRLTEVFLAAQARKTTMPDYPRLLVTVGPLAWIVLCVIISIATLRPGEINGKD